MTTTEATTTETTTAWEIRAGRREAFEAKIAQANAKLAKAGLDARFDVTYEDFTREENHVLTDWVRATLVGPLTLRHGHFTFAASLVAEEAGVTVHTAPGIDLGGYSPRGDNECDHCQVNRNRTRLYLVRDERDGSIIQLGHSCIELYTGIAPKGLWALTYDQELREFASADAGGYSAQETRVRVDWVIALAYAYAEQGRAYVSTQSVERTPTIGLVRNSLYPAIREREEDRRFRQAKEAEAVSYLEDAELIAAIKASALGLGTDSDYGRNMRVILGGETVSYRNQGILASLVQVYAKALGRAAERKVIERKVVAKAAEGFLGDVKTRLRDLAITLTTVREFDGQYGTTTLFVGKTADGHVVKWFASGAFDFNAGDVLPLKAATVKEHETFNGVDQTVITRGIISR